MPPRRRELLVWALLLFIGWNALLLLLVLGRPGSGVGESEGEFGGGTGGWGWAGPGGQPEALAREVVRLAEDVERELENQKRLLEQIERHRGLWGGRGRGRRLGGGGGEEGVQREERVADEAAARTLGLEPGADLERVPLPVLVLGCDRVTVTRCLDKLLRYRPGGDSPAAAALYPLIVSQDCGHAATARAIAAYGDRVTRLEQPQAGDVPAPPEQRRFQGYYRIARHYRWALGQVFGRLGFAAAVVVEDDLDVAADFYEYFRSLLPVLASDPSLWCVSAWHDNGKRGLVEPGSQGLLHRTDFFPGLGWMLLRGLWLELEPKWPLGFWDDWLREPGQRRGRACVRPELSRTVTFGRKGVSGGQFYDQHLKHMQLSPGFEPFTERRRAMGRALRLPGYDREFQARVYSQAVPLTLEQLQREPQTPPDTPPPPARLEYSSRDQFKTLARALGVMDDLKSGVPRAGYRGVVTVSYRGRRVYLAPPAGWTGYNTSWT